MASRWISAVGLCVLLALAATGCGDHTHGKAKGTGLGLSICKKIIEDHGGRLWARANDGPGLTVSFSLPVFRSAGTPAEACPKDHRP